uniref:Chitin-binding type-4 domain-containing protein n=1 Tax=Magallana gigas TaxID=29159 RepID=A0A8W8KC72_MAGGI
MYFSDSWTRVPEPNTDYDSLNCGNVKIPNGDLEGKCGVCGDYYNGPRHNEVPNGKYASIRYPTYVYREGSVINVTVEVSENGNGGYFMFKLCDSDDAQLQEKQSCFDNTVLSLARSPNVKKVYVPKVNASNDIVVPLQLPDGFECKLCTMQWTWVTNIDVGCQVIEGERICGQGIGPQTTLVNCADISIISKSIDIPESFPWPDFTSKYDSMAHKDDDHNRTAVDPPFRPPVIERIKDDDTPTTTKKPPPVLPVFPKIENPYNGRKPTIPDISDKLLKPDQPVPAKKPKLDIRDYKKTFGGLGLGLLEILLPAGLLLGFGGMLSDRLEDRRRLNVNAQPGLLLNGGVGLSPVAAEHGVLIGEQILPFGASAAAAGGLVGGAIRTGVPGAGAVPVAGLSPVVTGLDFNDAQLQQIIPLIPIISTPEAHQLIPKSFPDSSRLGYLIPLIVERRRLVQIFPHLNPHQITQMHLQYRTMQRQGRIGGGIQGQSGINGANQVNNINSTNSGSRPSRGDIANPEFEFDREPGVLVERESRKRVSPYSENCPPEKQICRSKFTSKEPTIYGTISIMEMICELECEDGKHSCPANICICACPEVDDASLLEILESLDDRSRVA